MRNTEAESVPKGFYDVGNWTLFREQKYVVMWVFLVANVRAIYTRRVKRQYSICWLKKELSMVHGTLHIFFRNNTFLSVKIES